MAKAKEIMPVVLCEPCKPVGGVAQWRFWCPFCSCYHHHGAMKGHRVAHCHDRFTGSGALYAPSPFRETGYVLKLDPRYAKRRERAPAE
jgi:hypothetical protein